MFYYKITGTIVNEDVAEKLCNRHQGYEERSKCFMVSDELFDKSDRKSYVFISNVSRQNITMGLVCSDNRKIDLLIRSFIRKLDISITDVDYAEITFRLVNKMLRDADRADYINSAEEVLDVFGIYDLNDRGYGNGTKFRYDEKVLDGNKTQPDLDCTSCFMVRESLNEEIGRISSGNKKRHVEGHPVHYLIQSGIKTESVDIAQALVGSLYANNRLQSKRFTTIGFKSIHSVSVNDFEPIYVSGKGGTVLVQVNYDNDRESNYAPQGYANLEALCSMIKKYANDVLTILWIPKTSETTKKIIYEELGHTNLVEICEKTADPEGAKEYLKILSKEKGAKADKKLFEKIEDGKHYLSSELNDIYDLWYSNKLKSVIFPQYKGIESVKNKIIKDEPTGSAYDELMEMIGLDNAKKVIKQALDYNKAQKVFADKGMQFDRTSMHMVFTGNPGTAKTSVARLFAQIMKDNDVLTQGKLVECGRADLVGKYVGWTAPTVKRKFKEAEGSVLFIDEAYSLVDDRDGLYGDEAINTIVQEMENHRDDVIVVFAGYPDKMEQFLQKNPGLRSRIAYHVAFDDYNEDELCSIADLIAKKRGLILADDAREKLHDVFDIALKESDFGNGRYVRNVIEKAKMAQASRLLASDYSCISCEDIKTIVASDIEMPVKKAGKMRIGFCA